MIGEMLGIVDDGRNALVTLSIEKDDGLISRLDSMKGHALNIEMERIDKIHSHSQRKYFHQLNRLLAWKRRISFQRCKNDLLAKYGCLSRLPNGDPIILTINVEPDIAAESESNHLDFVRYDGDGWVYKVLKGTGELTVREYNELIDIAIYECRSEGIETDTPEEIAYLKSLWLRKGEVQQYGKKK